MKILEVPYNGQVYGYIVGENNVVSVTKRGQKVTVIMNNEKFGKLSTVFDLRLIPMYTLA